MMKERERRDKEEEEWIKEAKQTKEKERDKLSGPPPPTASTNHRVQKKVSCQVSLGEGPRR